MTGSEHNDEFFVDEFGQVWITDSTTQRPTCLLKAMAEEGVSWGKLWDTPRVPPPLCPIFLTPGSILQTRTRTNRSGGVQGGISNGEDIVVRLAFKPTSTIAKKQNTVRQPTLDPPRPAVHSHFHFPIKCNFWGHCCICSACLFTAHWIFLCAGLDPHKFTPPPFFKPIMAKFFFLSTALLTGHENAFLPVLAVLHDLRFPCWAPGDTRWQGGGAFGSGPTRPLRRSPRCPHGRGHGCTCPGRPPSSGAPPPCRLVVLHLVPRTCSFAGSSAATSPRFSREGGVHQCGP